MNRREFVKALAGVPLLGLLVKVPDTKAPETWMMVGPGFGPIEVNEEALEFTYKGSPATAEEAPPPELTEGIDVSGYHWMKFEFDGKGHYMRVHDED